MAYPAKLEIQVHLSDGSINRFTQTEPDKIRQTLDNIQPERVFAQRQIILSTESSLTVYPSSAVARLDLVMDGFPGWAFHHNVCDIEEITPGEFHERIALIGDTCHPYVESSGSRHVYGEMELTNGERLFREVHLRPQNADAQPDILGIEQSLFLQQMFSLPGLYCKRNGGGAVLVNSAHLLRMTFYPHLATAPENAWALRSQASSVPSPYLLAGEMCG